VWVTVFHGWVTIWWSTSDVVERQSRPWLWLIVTKICSTVAPGPPQTLRLEPQVRYSSDQSDTCDQRKQHSIRELSTFMMMLMQPLFMPLFGSVFFFEIVTNQAPKE